MKRKLTRTLCLLCALIMLFSASGIVPATASDGESASESGEAERAYDPAKPSEGADTGLFVITGTDEPLGVAGTEEFSDIPKGTGRDAETLNAAPKVSETGGVPADDDTLGSSVVAPGAKPTITLSETSVSLKAGETSSVTVTIGGYPEGAYLQSSNNNFNAFSSAWGDWRGTSIPLRITGKDGGSGSIALRLKDTNNKDLASVTLSVTVLKSLPTLTVSPETVSVNVGQSQKATLTIKNYSGGGSVSAQVSDGSVCDVKFGAWSGWTVPVTVTGKADGNAKITLKLYNSARTQLASVTFSASVCGKASLSVSPGSPSMFAGESAMLTVSVSGPVNDGDYLQYSVSNPTAFSAAWTGKWSGQSMKLNLTGKNAGSGALTVRLKSRAGVALDEKILPVEVSVRNGPKVSVSPSSVNLAKGASADVRCAAQNISESFCLRYVNNSPALLQCVWQSRWSGTSVPLTITGKAAGTGSVTVELIIGSTVRASATITVNVTSGGNGGDNGDSGGGSGGGDNGDSGGGNGGGQTGQSPSYAFDNYSKPGISLAICQYMFGNTQRAKTVYDWDIGNGGVCFGMSATSALLLSPNQPNADAFGNALIAKLKKSDYSGNLQMSLSDFIEAMHISQVASAMKESSGVSAMVSAVRNGGTSQPVIICMRGPGGGHAILAYGLTSNGSLRVYDSNWPGQERTLTVNGSQWSYNLWQGLTWSSSNAKISYIPYSVYSAIWSKRGSLNGARLQDGGVLNGEEELRYLLVTDADDFTLLDFDGNVVARYEKGVLYDKADAVEEVFLDSVLLKSENPAGLHMLYVPEDLYTVRNRSGKMDVALSGLDLSIRVTTEAEAFDLAVSDDENYANAILNLSAGQEYAISVGSSRDGEPDETSIEGVGNGQAISLGMGAEGLYISDGKDDVLSLGELEEGGEGAFKQDFALNSKEFDAECQIDAAAGEGGTVSPEGVTTVLAGGNQTYRIQPDAGYALKALYVNGVEAAYSDEETDAPHYSYQDGAYEYVFRDVEERGYLYAEFAKEIDACEIRADYDGGELTVTVTDPSKEFELEEGADYVWSTLDTVGENGEPEKYLVVQALSGSDYSGVAMEVYTVHTDSDDAPRLSESAYDRESNEIRLTAVNADTLSLAAAAYAPDSADASRAGKMLAFFPASAMRISEKTAQGVPVRIPLDGATLPEECVVRVFLLSDTESLRVMGAPISVAVAREG